MGLRRLERRGQALELVPEGEAEGLRALLAQREGRRLFESANTSTNVVLRLIINTSENVLDLLEINISTC